ncbi:MAG: hypothetical protein HN564_03565 [Flavobacteriales bacterium]|jgi:hypothetical protein|nr:hypothetical protein [Flavobacteriales bacterium]|tara:strand:- start:1007 stop:1411 length:405 start_codon:yes stop_codon:yes gene_type:complete
MKQFIILLFFLPLSALASFPIEINLPKDTTIEVKKETMEEYKLRINKQLYSASADDSSVLIQKEVSPALLIFSIICIVFGAVKFVISTNKMDGWGGNNDYTNFWQSVLGAMITGLGLVLALIDLIRRAILKRPS